MSVTHAVTCSDMIVYDCIVACCFAGFFPLSCVRVSLHIEFINQCLSVSTLDVKGQPGLPAWKRRQYGTPD